MKTRFYKHFIAFLLLLMGGVNFAFAQENVTLWEEDFSSYKKNDVPSGGTYNYSCVDGGTATKIYEEKIAGGESPELLVSKKSNNNTAGSFSATIPLDNIEGDLTLTFKKNKQQLEVKSTTTGITGSFSGKDEGEQTLTLKGVTASMTQITIVFSGNGSSNVRLDDIKLVGTKAESASAATLTGITLSGDYPTTFAIGDAFSHEGMVVTAAFDDDTTADVTSNATFSAPDMTTEGEKTVTVSYTKGGVTKTAEYVITVSRIAVTGITLDKTEASVKEGGTLTLTATIAPENATNKNVTWESSDPTVATVESGVVTALKAGTTDIKATTEDGGLSATCVVTVTEVVADTYLKVDDIAELSANDQVIIVNETASKAMGKQNNNNRAAAGITINNGKATVEGDSEVQALTLEGDAEGWYFNTGSGYLYAASNSSNHLKTQQTKNDNAKASITIANGTASIQFQGTNSRNLIRYNSTSSLFSCYASSTSESDVQLYKKESNKQDPGIEFAQTSVTIDIAEAATFVSPTFSNPNNLVVTATSTNEEVAVFDIETSKIVLKGAEGTAEIRVTSAETDTYRKGKAVITVNVIKYVTFVKITSADDLTAGTRYVIVSEGNENKILYNYGSSYFTQKNVTISNGEIKITAADANFLTLGGEADAYTFATGLEGGYLALTSDGNYLNNGNDATTDAAKWTITFDSEGNAEIKSNNIDTRYIMYNSQSPRFACYTGTQRAVQLYMEVSDEYVDVPVTSAEWATFVAPAAVRFAPDVTAYIITSVEGSTATAEKVTKVPEGTAVVVNGTEGTHKAYKMASASEVTNLLLASDGTVTGDSKTIYVLTVQNSKPGFARLSTGKKLEAGKAYLKVASETGNAKLTINFDGDENQGSETTVINGIETNEVVGDGAWYNLQGAKVAQPQRGIYIHNGKKVVIK